MELCKERLSESSILGAVATSDSKHSTRSKIKTSQEKRTCFICDEKRSIDSNQFNQGGLGRCCQESSAQKLISSMQTNLVDNDSNWYAGAKRLELLFSGPSHDIFAVDVYYHQSCYLCFTKTKKASIEDGTNFDKEIVIGEFNTYISVKIIKEKSAYLLNELLKDSNYFSSEFGIKPVFTCTKSL